MSVKTDTTLQAQKRARILAGETQIMSDAELDAWISDGMPDDVVSINNPRRCGLLDAYVVGLVTNPLIAKYRSKAGIAA